MKISNLKFMEAVARAVAPPIRKLAERVDALEALAGIGPEQKTIADCYMGVWKWGSTHKRGHMVTDHGSLWMCIKDTDGRPNTSRSWRLISKNGKPPEMP